MARLPSPKVYFLHSLIHLTLSHFLPLLLTSVLLLRFRELGFGFWERSFLTGAVWGVWHMPIIFTGHNYPWNPYAGSLLFIGVVRPPFLSNYSFPLPLCKHFNFLAQSYVAVLVHAHEPVIHTLLRARSQEDQIVRFIHFPSEPFLAS